MEQENSIINLDRHERASLEALSKLDKETRRQMLIDVEQRRQEALDNLNALSILKVQLSILEGDDNEAERN